MNNSNIDTSKVDELFDRLDSGYIKENLTQRLMEIGEDLKQTTIQNIKSDFGSAATSTVHKSGKSHKAMVKGVGIIKEPQYSTVVVSIMKQASLKLFELGTNERYLKKDTQTKGGRILKKGERRGRIQAVGFFRRARISVAESDVLKELEDKLKEVLNNQ